MGRGENFSPFEQDGKEQGHRFIAGVDEAGRGPLAGPVVAAAVILPEILPFNGIKDSKLLKPLQREKLSQLIFNYAIDVGIGIVDHTIIDSINILKATFRAMQMAVEDLDIKPDFILVDGPYSIPMPVAQLPIKGGDRICRSIAAASIIAKVTRDRIMDAYHINYPQFNFVKNRGYATKEHLAALKTIGYCDIHRKTFRRVRELVT